MDLCQLTEHRRKHHHIHQLRIKLGAAPFGDGERCGNRSPGLTIRATVRHHVEGIGETHDPRQQRDPPALEPPGITLPIPPFVVGHHPVRQFRIERRERRQDIASPTRVRGDGATLLGGESAVIVSNIKQRCVDLSDVVKECDPLECPLLMGVQTDGVTEDEGIPGHAPHMLTRFLIIGVDRVQQ